MGRSLRRSRHCLLADLGGGAYRQFSRERGRPEQRVYLYQHIPSEAVLIGVLAIAPCCRVALQSPNQSRSFLPLFPL